MGTEQFANGSVSYTSATGAEKTCIDSLKDDAHYRFSCRCGCGAQFAGYGRDIKASGKVGRAEAPTVTVTTNNLTTVESAVNAEVYASGRITQINADPRKLDAKHSIEEVIDISTVTPEETNRSEAAEIPSRPFVSDRYLKKASFGLSDDEIDAYHEDRDDPLEAQGINLAERRPPAIADMVYSLATGEGPYSLLEYQHNEIDVEGGGQTRVLCGLCRTDKGSHRLIPLADLALHYDGRPVVKPKRRGWVLPLMVILASSLVSAAVSLAYLSL